ncbi:Bug family tripartite tricarboxylate transporter substrate binding protein [Variovorax saccharolyticus]|uniref:Bug family tripartite tricarboxylate transporter substrate binding protein n=1 Tax=Variovorax saccharolyticus TaxID=3053516 RepID=UPI0025753915|nr:tripartite tricarboxylate transporter substrate binding protein [Variovorax sp. J31P216]MDM0025498.1 tripartite tricarboxylate transporter substrate binding protein [Variovorax sp. J31P216]
MTSILGTTRRSVCLFIAGSALALSAAHAQDTFPSKPITMIVGWATGGSADNVSRLIAQHMSTALGQPVLVDNRAGAGSNIASELVAKSKPDGYTIMLATPASHGYNSALYSSLKFRPMEDFSPIGMISTSPGTMLVPVDSPYKTLRDLIAAAKAAPGKLNYGSAGVGSSQHLAGALFNKMAGVDIAHIPFKGSGPAMTEMMAGRLDVIITTGPLPFVQSGKVRPLAIASHQRHPAMPTVPTFEEAGLKGYITDNWYGLVAPANTPRPVLDALNAALVKSLASPDVQKAFVEQGAFPAKAMKPDEFWAYVRKGMPEMAEQVRAAGAKMD